jgi:sulfur carrier protein
MIDIVVNGETRAVEETTTVNQLIESFGLSAKAVIVELSGDVITKDVYATTPLSAGDRVEIIRFVGGG